MQSSLVISSLTSRPSISEFVISGGEVLTTPLSWVVMSVSFRWISCCCFLESLGHCTSVLLVLLSRSNSVLDPNI